MNIIKTSKFSAIVASLVLATAFTGSAMAADGTITFTGSIARPTCSLNTTDVVVNFGVINATDLTAGKQLGPRVLSNTAISAIDAAGATCDLTGASVFVNSTNINASNGRIIAAGAATGLEIELYNEFGIPLYVGDEIAGQLGVYNFSGSTSGFTDTGRFSAQVFAGAGGATPGNFNATAVFGVTLP